jgi:tetratricopeptide (TPR) repeat protein
MVVHASRRSLTMPSGFVYLACLLLFVRCGFAFAGETEWRAHMQAGEAAQKRGDQVAASTSFDAGLREAEAFGPRDPRLAATLSRIALHRQVVGRLSDAESLYQRALAIRESTDGPEHRDVASDLDGIAGIRYRQGRYAEAVVPLERAIAIWQKVFGPDDSRVAAAVHRLGQLHYRQSNYAEAESLYRRALALLEKTHGMEHPSLMPTLNNLAVLYYGRGDLAQAEVLSTRLLALSEKVSGPDHRDVARSLYQLADVHRAQGRFADAEPLYSRALEIVRSRPPIPGEPDAQTVQRRLDDIRRMRGIWERDRWLLRVRSANQARERGEIAEAERLCVLALRYVGARTVSTLDDYASLLAKLNRQGAQEAKARAEKLRNARLATEPGSVYLGFNPADELRAYAALLRELSRNAEATAVSALADAETWLNFTNFTRNHMVAGGQDPSGTCSLSNEIAPIGTPLGTR